MRLHPEDTRKLLSRIDNEGFNYCFIHYSDFREIQNERFHELRKAYIDAYNELNSFIDPEFIKQNH